MNIERLLAQKKIKQRSPDVLRARALVEASERNAAAALRLELTEMTSSMAFETLYRAITQLGAARWWMQGYEAETHDVSLEILKDPSNPLFQHLDRFRQLRHDEQYRGYKITSNQVEELRLFWSKQIVPVLSKVKEELVAK